jgi:phage-related baseplate assembly protein
MADKPEFIERDPNKIIAEMVAYYEAQTGKTLHPAQPERLLINTFAYRELLIRQGIQDAAVQNLVAFSTAPVLDYLGELVGVFRLPARAATCTLRFTLYVGHTGVIIPAGTRVTSVDSRVVFRTISAEAVPAGVSTYDAAAECEAVGEVGNNFLAGEIRIILDPIPNVLLASNSGTTGGGAETESDQNVRERIRLAPASFSTAGPTAAYIFHARSAHQSIIDVAITNPIPGQVNVYPLVAVGDFTPAEVIEAVESVLNAENVRPLTDTVVVLSPSAAHYSIVANVQIYPDADPVAVQATVEGNLQAFAAERRARLGVDITDSQVLSKCQIDGVYRAFLTGWTDVVIENTSFPVCDNITVNVTTIPNG